MILFLLFLLITVYLFNNFYYKRRHLPPGPTPLPVLGNILSFTVTDPVIKLIEWKKKYGNVYTYWLGDYPLVSVNDLSLINEYFIKDGDTFSLRPTVNLPALELFKNGRTGIIFNDGNVWKDLKRFSLHTLRNFGLGKNMMQERILDEITVMLKSIQEDKNSKNVVNIQNHLDISIGSIIMQLIFGYKYSSSKETREEFFKFKFLLDQLMKDMGSFAGLLFTKNAHQYKYIPYFSKYYDRMHQTKLKFWEMFDLNIQKRKNEIDFDSNEDPTDYIEAFLRKEHELKSKNDDSESFTYDQLTGSLWDMWVAGQETTSNTIGWSIVYLMNNYEVQKKVHDELSSVINSDRLIRIEDKTNLHYLNAVITETQRLANIVVHNIHHRANKDVVIDGHFIPKDTIIVNQLSTVMYEPEIFPEPLKFIPERHLDENNNYRPHPAVIPFGVGKRSCLGESLARMELFLFMANIFNHFEITTVKPIKEYREPSASVPPPKYSCIVNNRF